jgi:predicted nuclease with RNAse H fold
MREAMVRFVGIDPGASAIHCVLLDDTRRIVDGHVLATDATEELALITSSATAIAIDAPAAPSTAPHAQDPSLVGKFRTARCCEIALGRQYRLWVPWVTPVAGATVPSWMQVGFGLYADLAANGHSPIEVFPYAGFRLLSPTKLAKKTTRAGIVERIARLEAQGITAPWIGLWSHDALDATLAALLALRAVEGTALAVGCGHDDSAIWVPRAS